MSTVQESSQIQFNLVPQQAENEHKKVDGASVLSVLSNLLETLSTAEMPESGSLNDHTGNLTKAVESLLHHTQTPPHISKKILLSLMVALQELQQIQANVTSQNSEVAAKSSTASMQNAQQQYQQIQQDIYEQEHQPWWKKAIDDVVNIFTEIVEPVVSVALIVVGAVTMQPELMIAGGLMLALEETPLMSDMTKGFEDILKACDVPDQFVDFTANVLSFITVTVATAGLGTAASFEVVADDAATAATEVVGDLAEDGTEALTEKASETASETKTEGSTNKKFNWKRFGKVSAMGSSLALSMEAPQLSASFFEMFPNMNGTTKKILQALTTVVLELVAITGVIMSGKITPSGEGTSRVASSAAKVTESLTDYMSEKMPELMSWLSEKFSEGTSFLSDNAEKLQTVARRLQLSAMGANGLADGVNGLYEWQQSDVMENFGDAQSALTVDQTTLDLAQRFMEDNMNFEKSSNQAISLMLQMISGFGDIAGAEAEVMAENI